jgi:hypothetical protein
MLSLSEQKDYSAVIYNSKIKVKLSFLSTEPFHVQVNRGLERGQCKNRIRMLYNFSFDSIKDLLPVMCFGTTVDDYP